MMTGEKLARAVAQHHSIVHLPVDSVDWHSTASHVVESGDDFVEATTLAQSFAKSSS